MILRLPHWEELRRSQVALGILLLSQALLILFLARPGDASHIYQKAGTYLFTIGPFDAANDSNFDRIAQILDKETASKIVNYRILVTNIMLLFSATNLLFYPLYRNYLVGEHLQEQGDYKAHLLYFAAIFSLGIGLFWHANLNGDFFFIGVIPPNSSASSPHEGWWVMYAITQSIIIFWSGMLISIFVALAKSLLGSMRI